MTKVYVIHDQRNLSLKKAEKFGELVFCVSGRFSSDVLAQRLEILQSRLRPLTKDDWLLPIGTPALLVLAGGIQFERFGFVRLLQYDRFIDEYVPVNFGEVEG